MRVPFLRRKKKEVGAWDQWKVLPAVFPYLRPYRKLVVVSLALTVLGAVAKATPPTDSIITP